jgi:hypothetical protein
VARVGNVNEILDGHVVLDLECLDRIYLNAYVPTLQVGGQVVTFFNQQRNQPIASPALFQKMGETFRQAVAAFAKRHQIPVIRFGKRDRQIDVIQPYFNAATQPGVVAIGVAQEFQSVLTAYDRSAKTGEPKAAGSRYGFVRKTAVSPSTTSTSPTRSSDSASSSCARTSQIPAKFGRTGMSGPSARRSPKGWPSPNWRTGSRHAPTPPAGKQSAIGSARLISRPSSIAGWPSSQRR